MTDNHNNEPLVSVIIPAYNCERYLLRALQSVRDQNYKNLEICLTNDGSEDGTDRVVGQFRADNPGIPFSYIVQENRGLPAARNAAVTRSRGEYLCFLDADDTMKPECLRVLVDYKARYPAADIISGGCECLEYDSRGQLVARGEFRSNEVELLSPREAFKRLFYQNLLGAISVLVTRDIFDRAGGFNPDFRSCEDLDFWLRAARSGVFLLVPEVLGVVYKYSAGLSRDPALLYQYMKRAFSENRERILREYPVDGREIYRKALAITHLVTFDLYRTAGIYRPIRKLGHLIGILLNMPSLVFRRKARKKIHRERTGYTVLPFAGEAGFS